MAVYKRSGKSKFYWTRFTFDGREIRQSTKTANKKAAMDFEAALRTQLTLGKIGVDDLGKKVAKPLAFDAAVAQYLESLETKESTRRRYHVASKAPLSFFGKAAVTTIEPGDVERFRAWRKKQHKKPPAKLTKKERVSKGELKVIRPATVNRELALVSGVFRWLLRDGKVNANPVKGVALLKEENDDSWRIVSDQEFRLYLMATSQPLRDVAILMFETGMRPSEVFGLRITDLDFQNRRIQIRMGKTDAARRRLTMSDDAERVLRLRAAAAQGDLVFPGGKNGESDDPIVKLTNAHNAAVSRAKLRSFRLYDLRHTFATHLVQSGVDLMTVKAILGHSRLEMVQRYAHPTEQHQADAIARLEAFRGRDVSELGRSEIRLSHDSERLG